MSESNKIELSGIFSEGYGIIPKKLMRMNIHKNMKLILAYMLSYTGGGKNSCFPSYTRIAKDLHMSKSTVSENIKNCIELGFIEVKKLYDKNKFVKTNEYILKLLDEKFVYSTVDSTQCSTTDSTHCVLEPVQHVYCNNNNNNNIVNNNNVYIPLSKLLYTEHLKNDSKYLHGKDKNKVFASWAEDIRKLIEIDGRTYQEVENIIKWCKADDFWKCNILSGKKLREKFPMLYMQSQKKAIKKDTSEIDDLEMQSKKGLQKVKETFNMEV